MPIPFIAGPTATRTFEVITGLLPTMCPASTNTSASVDELIAVLNAVQGHMFTTAVVPTTTEGPAEDQMPAPLSPAAPSQAPVVVERSSSDNNLDIQIIEPPVIHQEKVLVGLPGKHHKVIDKPASDDESINLPDQYHKRSQSVILVNPPLHQDKGKGRAQPTPMPTPNHRISLRLAQAAGMVLKGLVVTEPPVVQPKCYGRPPKPEPIILKDKLVFDKKRFRHITKRFHLKEFPSLKKADDPVPMMPEPCLQCSVCKASAIENCSFRGWGVPCGPCNMSHVSSCEYYLTDALQGAARDTIQKRVAIHAPSALADLLDQIKQDALHLRTLSAMVESIRHCHDLNLREFANSLYDLFFTSEILSLFGTLFLGWDEANKWLCFADPYIGNGQVLAPDGSSRMDLDDLIMLYDRAKALPVAGPSSGVHQRARPSIVSHDSFLYLSYDLVM
ncbi:uncharacterized protein LACBIDRAFT_321581 [Laccaria bicolor S238N-H82]|uniref:Predicted protein n=1 Tax=Laccaria bicolor (strain S238N-H82 / ATCC MYA-4686) TaxID=486041 RepID=B0CTF5_LACBS|nr:uncharacterized protein LACBIDRAFT_321581 [Laccaria bicolor S238N-H82]EDR13910.1 predicted protein [Laccaria bicolor S238N-H82]|eukprot:XP_001874469.1 predicted protein [Laccaria bicolor S238N-H82]